MAAHISWRLRACPRCHGDVYLDLSNPGAVECTCMQCGWEEVRRRENGSQALPAQPEMPHPQTVRAEALSNSAGALFAAGVAQTSMAAVLGVAHSSVWRALDRRGLHQGGGGQTAGGRRRA